MNPSEICFGCMEAKGSQKTCANCGYHQDSGPESSHHLPPGTILANKYLVGKVLGQGGFGITYVAYDLTLELKLAVKEFFPMGLVARARGSSEVDAYAGKQKAQYKFGLDRFLAEAKTLARFSEHPNIVTVRDFFSGNGTAYMVMNYIEGKTLEEYLKNEGSKIPFPKMLEIMMPVMDALREVHQAGIIHRDISPDNIFIRNDGRVSLIDFGSARQELLNKSRSISVILKVGYSPEEQYRSRGEQGPWTDIYSVAATIYRGITGEVPPEAMDRMAEDTLIAPSQLGIEIGVEQEQALLKAFSVKAKERFRAVAEMQVALTNKLTEPAAEQVNLEEIKVQESLNRQSEQALSEQPVIEVTPEVKEPQPKEDESKQTNSIRNGLNTRVKVTLILACLIFILVVFILVDASIARVKTIVYDNGIYIGEMRFWKREGQGEYDWTSGNEYLGEWDDDKKHGQGVFTFTNGDKYDGGWENDAKYGYGQGIKTLPDGRKYVGEFIDGKIRGQGTMFWPDGCKYRGDFVDGKMHGLGTMSWPNGDKYVGEFNNDMQHGEGKMFLADGIVREGEWENGNYFIESPEVVVTVNYLRLRKGPGQDYDILQRLFTDDHLTVIGHQDEWLEVITVEGVIGWVHSGFVEQSTSNN